MHPYDRLGESKMRPPWGYRDGSVGKVQVCIGSTHMCGDKDLGNSNLSLQGWGVAETGRSQEI